MGPNGAGKTSLFEVLSGRLQPSSGKVFLGDRDITRLPIHKRVRLGIGRTYQSPVVPEGLPVSQVLRAARKAYNPKLTSHQAEWAAEMVRFNADRSALAGSLDTLNRRKLLLTCALMRRPQVLLLDEPASGLINSEVDELDVIVRYLSRELNIATLVVEHRLELLAAIADEVMVLDVGQKIAEGQPHTVFQNAAVRAAYFEEVSDA